MPTPSPAARSRSGAWLVWRIGVPVTAAAAGFLFVTSSISADGADLRSGVTDLGALVEERGRTVQESRVEVQQLRGEVAALTASVSDVRVGAARNEVAELRPTAGLTAVSGSGLHIALDDAPRGVIRATVEDANLLVVHQQDIQAFVNALWASGARAVSLQGQRLISTTGIKCVGNTVLLHGVPYSPPYRISAVGDPDEMLAALERSPTVGVYEDYVAQYDLGLTVNTARRLRIPAYDGSPALQSAEPLPG